MSESSATFWDEHSRIRCCVRCSVGQNLIVVVRMSKQEVSREMRAWMRSVFVWSWIRGSREVGTAMFAGESPEARVDTFLEDNSLSFPTRVYKTRDNYRFRFCLLSRGNWFQNRTCLPRVSIWGQREASHFEDYPIEGPQKKDVVWFHRYRGHLTVSRAHRENAWEDSLQHHLISNVYRWEHPRDSNASWIS